MCSLKVEGKRVVDSQYRTSPADNKLSNCLFASTGVSLEDITAYSEDLFMQYAVKEEDRLSAHKCAIL